MVPVLRMEGGIKRRIAGLDTQKVPMGSGLEPAPIGFLGLLSHTQGDAQLSVAQFLDVPEQAFHVSNELLILPFSGLESQGTIPVVPGPLGYGQKVFPVGVEPFHFLVVPADAAVIAVLDAPVGKFQQAPIVVHPAHRAGLYLIGGIVQPFPVLGISQSQQGPQVVAVHCLALGQQGRQSIGHDNPFCSKT